MTDPDDSDPVESEAAAAERVVLGAMLMTDDAAFDASETITGADFAYPRHEVIFDAVLELVASEHPHDPIAVADRLGRSGDLARCGGAAYLHDLVSAVTTPASAGWYAGLVREASMKRRVRAVGARLGQIAATDGSALELVEAARAELDGVVEDRSGDVTVSQALDEALAALDEGPGAPTPWPSMTKLIGGWKPTQLYIGAARPGVGKSVLALQCVLDMARRHEPVVMFSLEMSRTELWLRMLSSVAQVDGQRIQTRSLRADDRAKLERAAESLRGLPITVDDRPGLSLAQIQSKVRTLNRRHPLGLVVVDYLGLVRPPPGVSRTDRRVQVDAIATGLKDTARMFDVPLLAMAQLNRAIESRAGNAPMLSDLRESGGIEASADVVMLMHREMTTDPNAGVDPSQLRVHFGKNRHGPQTLLELIFRGHYSRIDEGPEWGADVAS